MELWAYGIREVGIVLRIIERKIWQNKKGRKVTSQTSLSNCKYYKNHLSITEYLN
jgi:hypothetical protein